MDGTTDHLLTVKDVAKRLRISQRRVHQLDLPKIRLGARTVRFRERDLDDLIERRASRD